MCRTRLEACRIENREFELAEGFKELGSDHADSTKSWDWVSSVPHILAQAECLGHLITLASCINNTGRLDHFGIMSPPITATTEPGNSLI